MQLLSVRKLIVLMAFACTMAIGLPACGEVPGSERPASPKERLHGKLEVLNGYRVLSVDGTPEQIGTAYGTLLREPIARVIRDMITDGIGKDQEAYRNILAGGKLMEAHQPKDYLDELKAIAKAAEVSYDDLLLLQYFGDVRRAIKGPGSSHLCTSFAIMPPHTRERACIVGRNFDYFDNGVGNYASTIVYYRPEGKIPFVTITWTGIANGWTIINEKGIVVSNNTSWSDGNRLEGISTCYLLRYVAERAGTVREGVKLIEEAQRACGTSVLVASGNPPDAMIVEFDCNNIAVLKPVGGFVGAGNGFQLLYQGEQPLAYWGRIGRALSLTLANSGRIDLDCNIAGTEGVPIDSMNLHSAMIDATSLRFRVAMGKIPAYRLPYRAFRLTANGVEADVAPKNMKTPE
ncbi:MAG TPA: C45 family peptidase [Planctomycetota bacterium]|nr:C45 family peptidase [Planctomycetota bacterium]